MIPHDSKYTRISESIALKDKESDILYRIMGKCGGRAEEIDCADTRQEAEYMVREYRMAFGDGWALWIVEQETNDD